MEAAISAESTTAGLATAPTSRPIPRVAVVLPVYNGDKYVAEAISSVLCQTFRDFELVIVNDGSADGTAEVLARFSDPRLRVISFPQNRGLVTALNTAIASSEAELIARMDADDICVPHRFEQQVRFLDSHPEVGICGTWTRGFGDESSRMRPPTDPRGLVRFSLVFLFAYCTGAASVGFFTAKAQPVCA